MPILYSTLHMARRSISLLALVAVVWLMSRPAMADEVVYKKHTVVEFGDDTIEGDLSKPDGAYLESRKRMRHQRLIKVRENFRPEILQSINGL